MRQTQAEELVIHQQRTTLPRRSMQFFVGDVTQCRTFCRAFQTLIEVKEPDAASKLHYLEQFTTDRVELKNLPGVAFI